MRGPVICLLFLLLPFLVGAGEFRLDTTLNGQVREDEAGTGEVPLNGYLGLGLSEEKWDFLARTDMRLFRDFAEGLDDYDLYQALLHIQPVPALKLDFGRQFVSQGFSTEMLDGILLGVFPAPHLGITLYSGIPRTVEQGDFNKNDGLLSGISFGLRNNPHMNAELHLAWRKNDVELANLRENDEVRIGTDLSYQWLGPRSVLLYGLFEYNVTGAVIEAGSAGVDLYPVRRFSLNLEFNYFNEDRGMDRQTILGLFTRGRLMTGRFAATWTVIPDRLDWVGNYSYQRSEIQQGAFRNGYVTDTSFPLYLPTIGLTLAPAYYFLRSFGGTLHGVRLSLHEEFTRELYADLLFDFSVYDKITSNDDNAFSTVLWAGYEVIGGLTLSAGFEYNRNNAFTSDVRGAFKIDYHYGQNI